MSFGLTNVHTSSMDLMNNIFKSYLDIFVIILFDDIIMYKRNKKDYVSNVRRVLMTLKDKELYSMFSKCVFLLEYGILDQHSFL